MKEKKKHRDNFLNKRICLLVPEHLVKISCGINNFIRQMQNAFTNSGDWSSLTEQTHDENVSYHDY
jgi:hypothetical protein